MPPTICPKCNQPDIKAICVAGNIVPGPKPENGNQRIVLGIAMFIPVFALNQAMDQGVKLSFGVQSFFVLFFALGIWLIYKGITQKKVYPALSAQRDLNTNLFHNGWTCLRCGQNWNPND